VAGSRKHDPELSGSTKRVNFHLDENLLPSKDVLCPMESVR